MLQLGPFTSRVAAVAVVGALTLGVASPPAQASPATDAASRAASWVVAGQLADGSFAGRTRADDVAETLTAVLAAGVTGAPVDNALGYIAAHGSADVTRPAYAGRVLMALVAAGKNPKSFGGVNYVARAEASYNTITGAYDSGIYANALAALGVLAFRQKLPDQAVTYIKANACTDGGFGAATACSAGADADTTALVVCALTTTGVAPSDTTRKNARKWLADHQLATGGWGAPGASQANANSTGLVLSAVGCLHEDLDTSTAWKKPGMDPLGTLVALEDPAGGFRYVASSPIANAYATTQAIGGALGAPYPFKRTPPSGSGGGVVIRPPTLP